MGSRARVRRWRRRVFGSVRGRATTIAVLVTGVIGLLCMVLALVLARDAASNAAWEDASRTANSVADAIHGQRPPGGVLEPRSDWTELVQIVDDGGEVLGATPRLRNEPPILVPAPRDFRIDAEVCSTTVDACLLVNGIRITDSAYGKPVTVLAAAPPPAALRGWILGLELTGLLLLLMTVVGWWTWRTVGLALRPVNELGREIAEINLSDTGRRVTVPHTEGEVRGLAEAVNHGLARLEEATGRERRFVSDASHDLRNPITALHTRLEVALGEDDGYDWRDMVREALTDAQRLSDIVVDLLELSRLDARAPAPAERVDLADLVRRELPRRPRRVPVETRLADGAVVVANRVRLSRVLGNLLSNAERHALSSVRVTVARTGDTAELEVLDDGSGIDPQNRDRVFERFARLSASRQRDPAGTGLGLPIAREIAETYGGSLDLLDSHRGARFLLRLPLAPTRPHVHEPSPQG